MIGLKPHDCPLILEISVTSRDATFFLVPLSYERNGPATVTAESQRADFRLNFRAGKIFEDHVSLVDSTAHFPPSFISSSQWPGVLAHRFIFAIIQVSRYAHISFAQSFFLSQWGGVALPMFDSLISQYGLESLRSSFIFASGWHSSARVSFCDGQEFM
jgi:hypothetical protein